MDYFLGSANNVGEYRRLTEVLRKTNEFPPLLTGATHIVKAHFLAALSREAENDTKIAELFPILVLVPSESEGQRLSDDINTMVGNAEVGAVYPAKDMILSDVEAVSREYEHRRLDILYKLIVPSSNDDSKNNNKAKQKLMYVFATAEGVSQLTVPPETLLSRRITLRSGNDEDMNEIAKKLIAMGYTRCEQIEGKAQFSIRGAILDVFPVNTKDPIRTEFWGDTIDTISHFDVVTQRRTIELEEFAIIACEEVLFESDNIFADRIAQFVERLNGGKSAAKAAKNVEFIKRANKDIKRLRDGIGISGTDKYLPLCYDKPASLLDYVQRVVPCEYSESIEGFRSVLAQHTEDLRLCFEDGMLTAGLERYMLTKSEFVEGVKEKAAVYFENFIRGSDLQLSAILSVNCIQLSPWGGEFAVLLEDLTAYMHSGYAVIVFAGTEKSARNLAIDLRNKNIPADYSDSPSKVMAKRVIVTSGMLTSGYDYSEERVACITHTAVTAVKKAAPKRKKAEIINSLNDIAVGDLVVHNSYGIGVFSGVQKLSGDKVSKDYIKIQYAGSDVLYVPVTQLDMISRYIGSADVNAVKLSRLHSDQWKKAKTKAKAAATEMASELIALYAKRLKSKGYAFPKDDEQQEIFDNHFAYVETEDQMSCIEDIKSDMERSMPMERLLCGDVGFGKTEVALRGAFKCVRAGKQCALLCPTTVLAWQHYQTVTKRMEGFGVKIQLLSRFRTPKEQKVILKQLKNGEIDMIIGTHRLVQNDVQFFDLGLVIIDEEQRFGVAHKEKFKEMFAGVDILTLSATPIPRTLNMAMSGIRDMSVIETPPQDRQPITTYVLEHDSGIIAQAIHKELRRNGQIYYIHNRVESIRNCAANVQQLAPEARIGIAHGQMEEEELLEVWRRLIDHEIDILVCTTLIETGVDVPNCNTLIIENADYMGLSQLHQLRGRVGRTNRRAFAYFTFKRGKVLSEIATKRLNAIREFTKFGSGFRIAMRDLEIRGAGSLLGASQSGHLTSVGYDMYLKLLNEAVAEQRGEKPQMSEECVIDIKLDAFIPEDYISNQTQRIACYRKIAMIKNDDDALEVTDELIDRYGDMPKSVHWLIEVAQVRNVAQKAMITEVTQKGDELTFFIDNLPFDKIAKLNDELYGGLSVDLTTKPCMRTNILKGQNPLVVIRKVAEGLVAE